MQAHKRPSQMSAVMATVCLIMMVIIGGGCGAHATEGAAKGAAIGAASSSLGTLVVGLVFNDPNLGERVARSAVYGATTGATAGAIAGASRDKQIKEQARVQEARAGGDQASPALREMSDQEIIKAIGEKNHQALVLLINCRSDESMELARGAEASFNKDYRKASLWIQAVAAVENGDSGTLDRIFPLLTKIDSELETPEKADAALATALNMLHSARRREGRPAECPSN